MKIMEKKTSKLLVLLMTAVMLFAGVTGGLWGESLNAKAAYVTPRLLVTGADIDGGSVKAGEEFDMVLHLKNESTTTKLMNISLKLSSEDNQIITTSGSDSIYIDSIEMDTEYDVTVSLKTRGNLEQKTYTLNVSYTYEDKNRYTYEDTAAVSVPVIQEPKLSTSEKRVSKSTITVDGKTSFSFKLNNLGKDKVYNVSVDFTGDNIKDISTYVGTIDVGMSNSVDMSVTGESVGEGKVVAVISYEDAEGNLSSFEEEFSLNVIAPIDEENLKENDGKVSTGLLIGGGVFLLIAIIIVVGAVKKKKEKQYE